MVPRQFGCKILQKISNFTNLEHMLIWRKLPWTNLTKIQILVLNQIKFIDHGTKQKTALSLIKVTSLYTWFFP